MGNKAILIGINHYDFLHPLKYAKDDALYVRDFLEREAGFEQVWYFSDDSPKVGGMTTRPIRNNLRRVLNQLSEGSPLSETDTVWFFFAGHGILHDGVDYLMPSDGDPDDPSETAIPTAFVLQRLRNCGAGNIILALDACRNQVRRDGRGRSGLGIGNQTVEEANKVADTICISACSPNEFSYELDDLQHGAFTYALIEGLGIQGRCATVEKLDDYLKHRVPALARAKQTPRVAIDPREKGHLILMPKYANKDDLAILKNDAHRAERAVHLREAMLLWRRVLAVDGTDSDAIDAIMDLSIKMYPAKYLSSPIEKEGQVYAQREVLPLQQEESNLLTFNCGNGVTLELVQIPAGSFMMGMPDEERKIALDSAIRCNIEREDAEDWLERSTPQHQVGVPAFLMGKYVVTNAQWQAVMGTKPSEQYDRKFQGDMQPVVGVTWHNARAFCNKLSENTGREVRLPTEAEWEYACRASTTTPFHFGETVTTDLVNYNGNYPYGVASKGEYREQTVDVDKSSPNAWGLYQMHGNVWEWCLGEFHDNYSAKPDRLKKYGNEAWGQLKVNEEDNRFRLLRGGSWRLFAMNCRSANRSRKYSRDRNPSVGFRVVVVSSL